MRQEAESRTNGGGNYITTVRPVALFLFGWFGQKNAGDDAILWSLTSEIERRLPEVRFKILAAEPCPLPIAVTPKAGFVRLSPVDVAREIAHSDILVIAGGTHITDEGSIPIRRLRAHLAMLGMILIARAMGVKVAHVSVGVGPLFRTATKMITQLIIHSADFVSVRDVSSFQVVHSLTPGADLIETVDVAWLLDIGGLKKMEGQSRKSIGVSVLPSYGIYESGKSDDEWLSILARSLQFIIDHNPDVLVKVVEFSDNTKYGDQEISKRLVDQISRPDSTSVVRYSESPLEMIEAVAECSWFIGMRYHSSLFSIRMGIPTIVVAYNQKCIDLAAEFNPEKPMLLIEDFENPDKVKEVLVGLIAGPDSCRPKARVNENIDKAMKGIPSSSLLNKWCRSD